MGYILPIQQHEYADYQKRMVTRKRTVSTVEKPYKTILKSNYEELKHEEELRNQSLKVANLNKEVQVSSVDLDEVYTELTGLGYFINERV
ncbi:hypothetical protein [Paucisalibacillus globulus]|uniref:hypothetical protein n=1 Tax=Paucisalibacillus globulus TaxID=351095 RepID=UPI000BB943F5|nr:hypothetical protein [Paucisalibacillus globulus]